MLWCDSGKLLHDYDGKSNKLFSFFILHSGIKFFLPFLQFAVLLAIVGILELAAGITSYVLRYDVRMKIIQICENFQLFGI